MVERLKAQCGGPESVYVVRILSFMGYVVVVLAVRWFSSGYAAACECASVRRSKAWFLALRLALQAIAWRVSPMGVSYFWRCKWLFWGYLASQEALGGIGGKVCRG